jgi:hypothetical protein
MATLAATKAPKSSVATRTFISIPSNQYPGSFPFFEALGANSTLHAIFGLQNPVGGNHGLFFLWWRGCHVRHSPHNG